VVERQAQVVRWFWRLPFNPDAPAQILGYIASQGEDQPIDRKTKRPTTSARALKALAKRHSDDPFYQLQLDWKALAKVDGTYAVGTLARLDADDRLHPEVTPKPSTLRDSHSGPNMANVIADRSNPGEKPGLASGFRSAIVARDSVPPGVSDTELQAWQQRWL